jgi:hypothetical protein
MERGRRRAVVLAMAAMLVAGAVSWRAQAAAQADLEEKAPALLILSAQADLESASLEIRGMNLGTATQPPRVTLGSEELAVRQASPQLVVAELPADVAPGSHLLVVSRGAQVGKSDRFAANIPSNELVTPAGIRLESTGSDVRIRAGNSHVTIDPSGGIVIESAGPLTVTSTGALDLRGRTVAITSDTSMTLRTATDLNLIAGTSLNANAAINANVTAGSTAAIQGSNRVAVSGSLITLN